MHFKKFQPLEFVRLTINFQRLEKFEIVLRARSGHSDLIKISEYFKLDSILSKPKLCCATEIAEVHRKICVLAKKDDTRERRSSAKQLDNLLSSISAKCLNTCTEVQNVKILVI